jgi:hypothetical protein
MVTSKSTQRSANAATVQQLDIDEFEAVETQIVSARDELLVLVKKSPHDILSKFKLGLVNGLLGRANALLVTERPVADFEKFEVDEIPSASDAVIVLGQYLAALENLRAKNIKQKNAYSWYWAIDGMISERRTYGPRSLDK